MNQILFPADIIHLLSGHGTILGIQSGNIYLTVYLILSVAQEFYIFEAKDYEEYGVHAGKEGIIDKVGRVDWQHATYGCIRTTEEAMAATRERFSKKDPLTHIIVEK